jgi:hypothetical protein
MLAIGCALAWLGVVHSAHAAVPLQVQSEGTCPSAEQVSVALDYLFKGSGESPNLDGFTKNLLLTVTDLGPRYQASLANQTHEYADPDRACEERARVVAVFAAITLEPPEVAARAKKPTPPARHFEFSVAAVSDVGQQNAHRTYSWGGELRASLVGRRWGIELGVGGQAPTTLVWGSYRAKITRFPLDLSLRGMVRWSKAVASLSAGPALAVFNLRGEGAGLPVHDGGTRLDVGVRSALSLGILPDSKVSPFVSLHLSVWPRTYEAMVDQVGQVGTTPQVWVGVTLGIVVAP